MLLLWLIIDIFEIKQDIDQVTGKDRIGIKAKAVILNTHCVTTFVLLTSLLQ